MVIQNELQAVFRALPTCCLILVTDSAEFTIVDVTDDYLNATGRERSMLLGKKLFEVFPDNPGDPLSNGPENLQKSLSIVTSTLQEHIMPVQRYDVPGKDDDFEEKYWLPINRPVFNSKGELTHLIHNVIDVTRQVLEEKEKFLVDWQLKLAFEHSALGMAILDANSKFLKVNNSLCHMLGYQEEDLKNLSILDETFAEDRAEVQLLLKKIITGKLDQAQVSKRYYKRSGDIISVSERISAVRDKYHLFQHFVVEVENVTEKQEIESMLIRSEQQYRSLFNSNPDAVFSLNSTGYFTSVNAACCQLFHCEAEDLIERRLIDFCGPESQQVVMQLIENALSGVSDTISISVRSCLNELRHLSVTAMPISINNDTAGVYVIAKDVTEKKFVFEELVKKENEVRTFAKQLHKVLEDERSRIAREIHDEFGQQLVGLKMSISALKRKDQIKSKNDEIVEDMRQDVNHALLSLKKFATDLRPAILDTLGLVPSLEWLLMDFKKKSGISCEFKSSHEFLEIPNETAICFFRVCQEALTNIIKHSEASKVIIEVSMYDNILSMVVKDNGKGFGDTQLNQDYSFGLIGMRERANLIRGQLNIKSSIQAGTLIQLITAIE